MKKSENVIKDYIGLHMFNNSLIGSHDAETYKLDIIQSVLEKQILEEYGQKMIDNLNEFIGKQKEDKTGKFIMIDNGEIDEENENNYVQEFKKIYKV